MSNDLKTCAGCGAPSTGSAMGDPSHWSTAQWHPWCGSVECRNRIRDTKPTVSDRAPEAMEEKRRKCIGSDLAKGCPDGANAMESTTTGSTRTERYHCVRCLAVYSRKYGGMAEFMSKCDGNKASTQPPLVAATPAEELAAWTPGIAVRSAFDEYKRAVSEPRADVGILAEGPRRASGRSLVDDPNAMNEQKIGPRHVSVMMDECGNMLGARDLAPGERVAVSPGGVLTVTRYAAPAPRDAVIADPLVAATLASIDRVLAEKPESSEIRIVEIPPRHAMTQNVATRWYADIPPETLYPATAPYLKTMRDPAAPAEERLDAIRWLQLNGYDSLGEIKSECNRARDEIAVARLAAAGGLPALPPTIVISNHYDPADVEALTSEAGQEAVMNVLRANAAGVRAAVAGIRSRVHRDDICGFKADAISVDDPNTPDADANLLPPGAVTQHIAFLNGVQHTGGFCCQERERCPGCGGVMHRQPIFANPVKGGPPQVIDFDEACERCTPERWHGASPDIIRGWSGPPDPEPVASPPRPDGFSQSAVDAAKAVLLAKVPPRGGKR